MGIASPPLRWAATTLTTAFLAQMSAAWCWTLALLGLGRRSLHASGPLVRYAREASYPIYILHQTVIVAIAFFIVGWDASVAVKYGAILLGASVGTLLIYEFLVRRINPVRLLFGMKPKTKEVLLARVETAVAGRAGGSQGRLG